MIIVKYANEPSKYLRYYDFISDFYLFIRIVSMSMRQMFLDKELWQYLNLRYLTLTS